MANHIPVSRIHVLGAPGSGTSTLGRVLAGHMNCPHFDTDDFFWLLTDPRYTMKRAPPERIAMLASATASSPSGWVLSGWLGGWGDFLLPQFDLVVFLDVPTDVRIARIRQRESLHYGPEAVGAGGPMHERHEAFVGWAASYETGREAGGRSRALQDAWIERVTCPVLRLNGELPTTELARRCLQRAGRQCKP